MAAPPLIPANWQIPDVLRNRLGRSVGRQRLMHHDGHLLIVAHQVPEADEDTRRGILFWRDADLQWKASNGDPGKAAIEMLLERYEAKIESLDQAATKAKCAEDYLPVLEGLVPVTRSSRNLYEVLQEARKTVPEAKELIDLRDRAYDLSRTVDLTYQYAKDSMDVAVVRRAEQQTVASEKVEHAAHKLNIMAALFFPLATFGSIFGTTLTENWSWSQSATPFLIFLAVGTVSGIWLTSYVSLRRKP